MEFGNTHHTSFFRIAATIWSATYCGSNIGIMRGFTPLNIPVLM